MPLPVQPIQVSRSKKQVLESACGLFTRGKKIDAKAESQAKEAELFQSIVKLLMELYAFKKSQQLSCLRTSQACQFKPP